MPLKGKLKVKSKMPKGKSENKSDKWLAVVSRVTVSISDAIIDQNSTLNSCNL